MKLANRIDLGPAYVRAAVTPTTFDVESRTVELVWSAGSEVTRYDWATEQRWIEELSLDPSHVRLARLNAGASLLDNHNAWGSVRGVIGVVERAWVKNGNGYAVVRFSQRDEVADIVRDVAAGIIRHVSVGYRVHRFENVTKDGERTKRMRAVDWEPFEVSLVTIPADAAAGVRSIAAGDTNPCEVIRREAPMDEQIQPTGLGNGETRTMPAPAPAPAAPPVDLAAIRAEAAAVERARISEIGEHCRALGLGDTVAQRLVDTGKPLGQLTTDVRKAYVELRAAGDPGEIRNRVQVGQEDATLKREAISTAMFHRMAGSAPPVELGELRGRSLVDLMRFHIASKEGASVAMRLSRDEVIKRNMHTTSDFTVLLQEAGRRTLRDAYGKQATTYQLWTKPGTLVDFRPTKRVQLGDAPALKKVAEGARLTYGTIGETAEPIVLDGYSRAVTLSRQAIVNDDLNAFGRLIEHQARQVAILVEGLAFAQLTAGTVGGSSIYNAGAPRFNLTSGGASALTADSNGIKALAALATLMEQQKSVEGDFLAIQPRFLIVPPALRLIGEQLVAPIAATTQKDVNPYRGQIQVVASPRLTSAVEWYLLADPNSIDTIEVAWLEGMQGPQFDMEESFETRGVSFSVWADVAAKAIDHRGVAKSAGA